jgi:hypothetical protein
MISVRRDRPVLMQMHSMQHLMTVGKLAERHVLN